MKDLLKIIIIICPLLIGGTGCDEDSVANSNELIGTWELAYYQTEENGRINDPNDGKPVYWNLKSDSTYEGMAGNNFLEDGEFKVEGDQLIFKHFVTEITTTEWEERFYSALRHSWNGEAYAMPYVLENNELILN
jgi:hypothetical protein